MKKVTILVGSAREGNSKYLADEILKKHPAEIIQISSYNMATCTGCLDCDETKKCIFEDDMDDLINKVTEAEVIIAITPVRWGLLSGDLKMFIDRLNPIATTDELVDKSFIGVAIGQSEPGDTSIQHTIDSLTFFAESAGMNMLSTFSIYDCLMNDDLEGKEDITLETVEKIVSLIG